MERAVATAKMYIWVREAWTSDEMLDIQEKGMGRTTASAEMDIRVKEDRSSIWKRGKMTASAEMDEMNPWVDGQGITTCYVEGLCTSECMV